jgi:hypothetical protein
MSLFVKEGHKKIVENSEYETTSEDSSIETEPSTENETTNASEADKASRSQSQCLLKDSEIWKQNMHVSRRAMQERNIFLAGRLFVNAFQAINIGLLRTKRFRH